MVESMINVTNEDLLLLSRPHHLLIPYIKMDIYDDNNPNKLIASIDGLVSGSSSIDADSDIRRTFTVSVIPSLKSQSKLKIGKDGLVWLNKIVKLYIGLYNNKKKDYNWYPQGLYVFMDANINYDATTNQLSINCSDLITKLDGTKNGQLGALITKFPAYTEDEETGEVIEYFYIRDAIITVLQQLAKITEYNIDDIGEFYAMPQYNENYEKYREENPLWNTIPYDLEFSCGCSVLSILTDFRDLYPNYEMFFDENGCFIFQMIPSCYYDDIALHNDFIQKILISENTSIDLSTVRNVCEVWGQVIDTDFYTEDCILVKDTYVCNIKGYEEKYANGDFIAIKIPAANPKNCKININNLGALDVCSETVDKVVVENSLQEHTVYVFKIKKTYENNEEVMKACLLGHWQAHGINVLTNGTTSTEQHITLEGKEVAKYSKEYFKDVYGCENVELTIIPNSPFTVQEIGEILDVKTGGDYENITSDSLALARAEYENWKNCRLTDSITITTLLCPFADVNMKVSYKRNGLYEEEQYIVKSISHDFTNAATTWTLMRFYPLYADTLKEKGTHKVLSDYTYGSLGKYTHEQLRELLSTK